MPARWISVCLMLAVALPLATSSRRVRVSAAPPSWGDRSDRPSKRDAPRKSDSKKKKKRKVPRGLAYRALRKVVADARFEAMTLDDLAEWINRTSRANVVVKWPVLDEAGVKQDQLINLKLRDVSIRKVLQLAFAQLTAELDGIELAAKADNNTLIISTKRDLFRELVTRIYEVQTLIFSVPNFTGRSLDDPTIGRGGRGGFSGPGRGRSGGGGGGYAGRGGGEYGEQPDEKVQKLINLITSTIQPESWRVNGGKGTIVFYKGQLVIRNNLEVHRILGGAGLDDRSAEKKGANPSGKPAGR